jgi:hypothetical protein
MSDRYNKYRWLELAFSEQVDRLNESYYFDRRDNEFFSVFITDYFLTDSSSTEKYPDNPYSPIELDTLAERINRLELNDELILSIPRLTIDERIQMMQEFLENRSNLSQKTELQKVIDAENGRTNLDFNSLLQSSDYKDWKQFKREFIEQKVDIFCNLQKIDFDAASLWTDKKMTSISLDIDKKDNISKSTAAPTWELKTKTSKIEKDSI